MQSFKDAKGRDWQIEITVNVIKKVRATLDIDLTEVDGAVYRRLDDPVTLVDLLWLICEEEAQGRNLTDEDFGCGLVGDPIEDATNALLDAIADFFPGRKRSLIQAMLKNAATLQDKAAAMAMAKIMDPKTTDATLEALQGRMDAEVANALTRLSGPMSSAASPASTPPDSP